MKVCILGGGLTSLALAKSLVNQGINIDFFSKQKIGDLDKTRTLGISKTNIDFFNKNILNIESLLWNIDKIEIYSDNLKNEKILNFNNKNNKLFSIIKNFKLNNYLIKELNKSKFINFKKDADTKNFLKKEKYKLIINCNFDNYISKKYFYKKINKNYNSFAYTTVISHKKLSSNNTAFQIFTKNGPLAFLPISESETSVVYSIRKKNKVDLKDLIKKYNIKYKIHKINRIAKFELKSSNLRSYYYKNILAFGDLLHKIHPLAGQGFNMSIRDINLLLKLIENKVKNGLDLDSSICSDFEKKIKHKNFLFSNGIDLIYEFFKLESKMNNNILSKSVQLFGKNKIINRFFVESADKGIMF